MAEPRIFLSYRRADTLGVTGRIHDHLVPRFGHDEVFRDTEGIAPGTAFLEKIGSALSSCQACLIIIGPEWIRVRDATTGERRLDQPDDPVRTEVELALARRPALRVIPVLVQRAQMPRPEELPASIRALCGLNALEIHESQFEACMDQLADLIEGPRRRWPAAVALLTAVLLALGMAWAFWPESKMGEGHFNIAVARFGAVPGSRAELAEQLSESAADVLRGKLGSHTASAAASLTIDVWSCDETGNIKGASEAERERSAEDLARRINADLVVYGDLTATATAITVEPKLFVSDRNFQGATELAGHLSFGKTTVFVAGVSVAHQLALLRRAVTNPTEGAARFADGLYDYTLEDYERARSRFAEAEPHWSNPEARALLKVFQGNVALRLGRFEEARDRFLEARRLRPEQARPLLGLAETEYLRGAGKRCSRADPEFQREALEDAIAHFERARALSAPASAHVPAKVAFGIGRAAICLELALGDHTIDGAQQLQVVIDEYDHGNLEIGGLASEAHVVLAVALDRQKSLGAEYSDVVRHLERAIELSRPHRRKAKLYGALGEVFRRRGDLSRAKDAYLEAIRFSEQDSVLRKQYEKLFAELGS